jgi:lipoprotein-anchoring transpeptidase ErfK/SrfK
MPHLSLPPRWRSNRTSSAQLIAPRLTLALLIALQTRVRAANIGWIGEESKGLSMHRFVGVCVVAALFVLVSAAQSAKAEIVVQISRSAQTMEVSVDGYQRYEWRVSTGRPGLGTPAGTYHPQSMARTWFSRRYYNSPMPHSIFFYRGYAIHGTYEISRLGGPASHGCVRLDPENAATLYELVQQEGMRATTIVVH